MPPKSSYTVQEEEESKPLDAVDVGGAAAAAASGVKSNKPANTSFKQQRLRGFQPTLTPSVVLPAFILLGLILLPVGVVLLVVSNNIQEVRIDYTGVERSSPCYHCAQNDNNNNNRTGVVTAPPCSCSVPFTLGRPMEGDVLMYYSLSNFYQNHRRYVRSRDDRQLNGDPAALRSPSEECEPYRFEEGSGVPLAPCGAVANSLFNDVLELYYVDSDGAGARHRVPLVRRGIAWASDKHHKFRNPPLQNDDDNHNHNLTAAFRGTAEPPGWKKPVYELDPEDPDNNGFLNEDLMVWMRTAALPSFRKLYRIVRRPTDGTPALPSGHYTLEVTYNYPVLGFGGRKSVILSTASCIGGKNPFLGVAYMTLGFLCLGLGTALLVRHQRRGNRMSCSACFLSRPGNHMSSVCFPANLATT